MILVNDIIIDNSKLNRIFGKKNVTHFLTHSSILGGYSRNSPINRGNVLMIAIKHQCFGKKK